MDFIELLRFLDEEILWSFYMVILLVGTGVLYTFFLRGLQFREMFSSLKMIFSKESRTVKQDEGDISPYAALMTALAATVGNGNIAGVATAIAIGGPGAPLWMWIAGLFGMATKYAEGFLGVRFREVAENGTMAGGPMYFCKNGIKHKKLGAVLGAVFAACGVIACLIGTGNMAQSYSMTESLASSLNGWFFHESQPATWLFYSIGASIAILVGVVIIGGIKRIGAVAEKLVPAMIVFYLIFSLWIILANADQIPAAYVLIFEAAFGIQPLAGAGVGLAIKSGVSRGVLSNEAGLGSAAIAQGASASAEPAQNGLIAMTGVFIDTIFVNTLTTLCIVLTGAYGLTEAWQGVSADNISGILVTQSAFNSVIPGGLGGGVVAFGSMVFGYTTLIGWSYYGEKCLEYLGGSKTVMPFRWIFIIFLFVGAIITPLFGTGRFINMVWYLGNIGNALMAFPNLVGLILLAGGVATYTRNYLAQRNAAGAAGSGAG